MRSGLLLSNRSLLKCSPRQLLVWYHQSFAYTTSHKQRVRNARLEPYTAACSSSGVATNSLFLPRWFSANKGAVLMQDKNILTDLSSSVCPTSGSSWRPTMKAVNELSLTHFCVLRVWLLLVCPLQSAVPKSYHALA